MLCVKRSISSVFSLLSWLLARYPRSRKFFFHFMLLALRPLKNMEYSDDNLLENHHRLNNMFSIICLIFFPLFLAIVLWVRSQKKKEYEGLNGLLDLGRFQMPLVNLLLLNLNLHYLNILAPHLFLPKYFLYLFLHFFFYFFLFS